MIYLQIAVTIPTYTSHFIILYITFHVHLYNVSVVCAIVTEVFSLLG